MKTAFVLAAVALTAATLRADLVTVDTGTSSQDFTLTGLGGFPYNGNTYGLYTLQQGSCSSALGTTTCTLSGNLGPGGSPGFTTGTYSFLTTFASTDVDPIFGWSAGPDPGPDADYFYYLYFAPDVSMVLDVNATAGTFSVPMVTNGQFDANSGFGLGYSGATCTGLGATPCSQGAVGLVAGATISGPVTISASFNTPEPALLLPLAAMLLGLAVFGKKRIAQRP